MGSKVGVDEIERGKPGDHGGLTRESTDATTVAQEVQPAQALREGGEHRTGVVATDDAGWIDVEWRGGTASGPGEDDDIMASIEQTCDVVGDERLRGGGKLVAEDRDTHGRGVTVRLPWAVPRPMMTDDEPI